MIELNCEVVRKLVQVYIDRNKLSNPEFAKQAKINDRTVRRLLNSEDSISDQTLEKMAAVCEKRKFAVIGFSTGKIYFRGEHHADCTRWINEQAVQIKKAHSHKKIALNMKEPMIIQRLPFSS